MPRPRLITALSLIQAVLALVFVGGVVNLAFVAQEEAHDPDAVREIMIGMAACGVYAFASVVAALGLWLQLRWGRWIALASLGTAVFAFAFGLYDDGQWEWTVLPFLLAFIGLLILYSLPRVGSALYRDSKEIPVEQA
jgi:uncharacterized membrane protein (DUF2068 family)